MGVSSHGTALWHCRQDALFAIFEGISPGSSDRDGKLLNVHDKYDFLCHISFSVGVASFEWF